MNLPRCVYEVVQNNPAGLPHKEIVREVLKMGYTATIIGIETISQAVHRTLLELVSYGAICRCEEDTTRLYAGKKYIGCTTARKIRSSVMEDAQDVVDYAVSLS